MDQKLLAQRIRHAPGAEFLRPQGFLQLLDGAGIGQPSLLPRAEEVEAAFPAAVKAGVQRFAGVRPRFQPVPSQPEHRPLIRLRRIDHGTVDHVVLHQHNVPWLEEIGNALHHIGDLAAQKKHQLIKLMVMVVNPLSQRIL